MVKNAKKKISKIKVKKKLWYKVVAPKLFAQKELGESYLSTPEKAIGRLMKVNLKDLTGNVKDQNTYIKFKISKVDGSILRTSLIGYQLTSTFVKRMVRKNTARLDDYFILKTKDGAKVILKSLTVTLNRTQRSTKKQVKETLKKLLDEEIRKGDFSTFVGNLVNRRVQSSVKKKLHKIYPLKEVAVRSLELKSNFPKGEEVTVEVSEEKEEKSADKVAEEPTETNKEE